MVGARVLGGGQGLEVEGHGPLVEDGDSELMAPLEVVGPASLTSFRNALRRWVASRYGHAIFWFTEVPAAKFRDPDRVVREDVELYFFHDELTIFAATYGDPEDGLPDTRQVEGLIRPLLTRHGATASVGVDDDEADYGGLYQLGFEIEMPLRARTVLDAYNLGKDVIALVEAADTGGGTLTRESALDLLRAGRVDALLGQRETEWVDFKRSDYALSPEGRLEIAKDVAMFANADGGIIVLGVATTKANDSETASAIIPCAGNVSVLSYRRAIERRVHPRPERIEMFSVRQPGGGDVWVIAVPPQPDELKPFLVHGAVINSKVNDNYFSIVTRRADEAVPTSPQAVHALLASGRSALRGPSGR